MVSRGALGAGVLVGTSAAVTAGVLPHRESTPYAVPVLLVLLSVVLSAAVGGLRVGLPGALAGFVLLNVCFTPPYGTLRVGSGDAAVVLAVYLATAAVVSTVTALASTREAEAAAARAEAQALSSLAGAALSEQQTLTGLLERVRDVFGFASVALEERTDSGWSVVEAVGEGTGPDLVEQTVAAGRDLVLRVRGSALLGRDERLLRTFADAAATALEGRQLAVRAAEAAAYEAADRTRAALLSAVGHDLRTPLSALRAASDGLRQNDVAWTPEQRAELLDTVAESTSRLQDLVENLLDASRLEVGVVVVQPVEVGLLEIVDRALLGVDGRARVHLELQEDLPPAWADPGLAERVVANVVQNALRYSPSGTVVTIRGTATAAAVRCDVVDHGPGISGARRTQVFTPFQRREDSGPEGLGLGLSVARGFARAMGGDLVPQDTPGGGLTMRLVLPRQGTA